MKNLFKTIFIAFIAILVTSCDDDNNNSQPQPPVDNSITGIAVKSPDLSILVTALTKADLAKTLQDPGEYTVFAPTNAAFTAFLTANGFSSLDAVPVAALKQILLNHVVKGKNVSTSLSTGYVSTLATYGTTTNNLSMFINTTGGVRLNGVSSVTTADVMASNGVVHIVDAVIGLPTIVTHTLANPNFSSLKDALTSAGQPDFVGILSGAGPFTVFAPTNAAFTALTPELVTLGVTVTPAILTDVLKYHVVAGANVRSSALTNNQVVTTYLEKTFTVELPASGAQIKDGNARISKIVAVDVQCSNGVIHAIDKVLLPGS